MVHCLCSLTHALRNMIIDIRIDEPIYDCRGSNIRVWWCTFASAKNWESFVLSLYFSRLTTALLYIGFKCWKLRLKTVSALLYDNSC